MKNLLFICFIQLISICYSNNPHWLIEFDCENNLNFFELHTLNTYNINNCTANDENCGEYVNLMYYSIFQNNKIYADECEVGARKLEYSLTPVNMAGSKYDLTPHFIFNLLIDGRSVIKDLPLFPSPLYNKSLWGLKVSSIRFNNNLGSTEILVSDDELYQEQNLNKMNIKINWLWDSNYISAFDPDWNMNWKPITEKDIWNEKNFSNYK